MSPSPSPTIELYPDGNIVGCFDVTSEYCQAGGIQIGCFGQSECAQCNYPNNYNSNDLHTCSMQNISQKCHDLYPSHCLFPTQSPTNSPSYIPTKLSTKDPSIEPTAIPISDPTKFPTSNPTKLPSEIPTNIPTIRPSEHPTFERNVLSTFETTISSTKTLSNADELFNDETIGYMMIIIVLLCLILCCICCLWIHRLYIQPNNKIKVNYKHQQYENSKKLNLQMSEVSIFAEKDKIIKQTDAVHIIEYKTNNDDIDENAEYTKGEVYNHLDDDEVITGSDDEGTPQSNEEDIVTSEGTGDDDDDQEEEQQMIVMQTLNVYKEEMKEKSSDSSLYLDYDDYTEQRVKNQLEENENMLNIYYGTKTNKNNQDKDNKIVIQLWLKDTVALPQYFDNFISHGFVSINIIKTISHKHELNRIGIVNKSHQNILVQQINKL